MTFWQYFLYITIVVVSYKILDYIINIIVVGICTFLKIQKIGVYLSKTISFYIFTSILGLLFYSASTLKPTGISSTVAFIIGLLTVYTTIGSGMYEKEKYAKETCNYELLSFLKYDFIFLVLSLVYYVLLVNFPFLAINKLTVQVVYLIEYIYSIQIIGVIVQIISVLYFFSICFYGIIFAAMTFTAIVSYLKDRWNSKKSSSVNVTQNVDKTMQYYDDGSNYYGELKDNLRHGNGVYSFADGAKYIGEFIDGEMHGQGTAIYQDGTVLEGNFSYGQIDGQCTVIYPDGTKETQIYDNGERID